MENASSPKLRRDQSRKAHNEDFVRRLYARRPDLKRRYDPMVAEAVASPEAVSELFVEGAMHREETGLPPTTSKDAVLETIVLKERPVLFVKNDWIDVKDVTTIGDEAKELVTDLNAKRKTMKPLIPLVGRIDVLGFPGNDFVGSGWFVDTDIVVTNRHVASLIARWDGRKFAFVRGVAGRPVTSSVSTLHEFDDVAVDEARVFAVTEVLYIERDGGPDIAFLKVARRTDGAKPDRITIAKTDVGENVPVFVVGYPARAPKSVIPDQQLMKQLYRDRYDVKRAAPGFTMGPGDGATRHDCTTLGGNSGSVVLGLNTGEAVGLHFAGLYQETNFAVRASVLSDYVDKKRWLRPPIAVETRTPPSRPKPLLQSGAAASSPPPEPPAASGGAMTITLPLWITVSLGQPMDLPSLQARSAALAAGPASLDPTGAEVAAKAFWSQRPAGVIAVRVGFSDDGEVIGDQPFIAASVPANQLDAVEASGPPQFQEFEVRYFPANVAEQIEALPMVESVDSIDYDDNARIGKGFSFDPVDEFMSVIAHVGPEYSWDELSTFLSGANDSLVSAMYEFHAPQIKDAIETRLKDGVSLTMVLDNSTFLEVKDEDEEFDRIPTFERWKKRFKTKFERIVAPEGAAGLISDAYHIKVTVREDDTLWLSSGNWKKGSSQPVITQQQRDNATTTDLPGNREWHVVIKNKTLANRFRNHIRQDFKRSQNLGGGPVPPSKEAADIFVDIPIEEEAVVPERVPPIRLLRPHKLARRVKVKPLLTPDHEGAVYSTAVLELIRSAEDSLLFQIPYISMRSNPNADRGFIDELIDALTEKLKTVRDGRVILRVGGSRFSAPTHAAWFFKSKGVDIDACLRQMENHHTKGMIVDGKRVLLGSHNWSKSGVTLNRDASLIFDDQEIAGYYAEAFKIDWQRANPIRPKRFVKKKGETVIREAVGAEAPPGFRRVRLSELLKEDDD
jgi:phosphatidylserine/phosphatidylglycerophosphate/cardiolipin synthase-like enzyme